MHQLKTINLMCWLFTLMFLSTASAQGAQEINGGEHVGYVSNQFIVKSNKLEALFTGPANNLKATSRDVEEVNARYGINRIEILFPEDTVTRKGKHALRGIYRLTVEDGTDLDAALGEYSMLPGIVRAEKISVFSLSAVPDDPLYQWHLENDGDHDIDAYAAWNSVATENMVKIAILDTGVRMKHRDIGTTGTPLAGNAYFNNAELFGTAGVDDDANGYIDDISGWDYNEYWEICYDTNDCEEMPCWPGEDCYVADNDPSDHLGHGTHVAGIAAARINNDEFVGGIAGGWGEFPQGKGAAIINMKIGRSANRGKEYPVGVVRMDWAAQAICYAVDAGAIAINCSWRNDSTGGMNDAADYADSNGVLLCTTAGNIGRYAYPDSYLCQREEVLCISASDSLDKLPSFSQVGPQTDLMAPGVDIRSTYHDWQDSLVDKSTLMSGTSMSAPMVTGAVALLKAYDTTLTGPEIRELIVDNLDDVIPYNYYSRTLNYVGRLNLQHCLNELTGAQDTTAPTAPYEVNAYSTTSGEVILGWYAPGDDKSRINSAPYQYEIRYQSLAAGPLDTEAEWSSATSTSVPTPQNAGNWESHTVSGMPATDNLYFQVRARDESNNLSKLGSSPRSLILRDEMDLGTFVNDIAKAGNIVYAALLSKLAAINASNPSNLLLLDTVKIQEHSCGMALDGNYAYIAAYTTVYSGYLYSFDISDPNNLVKLDSTRDSTSTVPNGLWNTYRGVIVKDGYAYVQDEFDGLEIYDVSDPSDMRFEDFYTLSGARGLCFAESNDVIFVGMEACLYAVDISSAPNLSVIDSIGFGNAANMYATEDFLYVSRVGDGVYIIDISDPEDLTIVGYYYLPVQEMKRISADSNLIGVGHEPYGFTMLDVSVPETPVFAGRFYETLENAQGILMRDGLVFWGSTPNLYAVQYDEIPPAGCCTLPGDANGDEYVNVGDLYAIYNYLNGGDPIGCIDHYDCNGNGSITGDDATYLVNYIFYGGPAPVCP